MRASDSNHRQPTSQPAATSTVSAATWDVLYTLCTVARRTRLQKLAAAGKASPGCLAQLAAYARHAASDVRLNPHLVACEGFYKFRELGHYTLTDLCLEVLMTCDPSSPAVGCRAW